MKKALLVTPFLTALITGCNSIQVADIKEAKTRDVTIITTGAFKHGTNSVGGIDVKISYASSSNDVIKYVVFSVEPYNKVGDKVKSRIGAKSLARLQDTGPLDPDKKSNMNIWKNVWYNHSVSCVKLVRAEIVYINGAKKDYFGSKVSEILTPESKNICTYESQLPPKKRAS